MSQDGESTHGRMVQALDTLAMVFLDPEGRVTSWNAGARRIFGYAADEILGRPFGTLHTTEGRAAGLPKRSLQAAREEGRDEQTGWCLGKQDQRIWARTILEAIRD